MESNANTPTPNATGPSDAGNRRRDFLRLTTGAVASAAIAGFPAIVQAQSQRRFLRPIVAGLNSKAGDPSYNSIGDISKILREKYGVLMELQVHPSSSLGTDISQLEAVQTGFIDITSNVTAQFSSFSKAFDFIDLPYAITSWDMALRVFKSDLWRKAAARFEQEVPKLKVLPPVGAGGFRLLWNGKRPLKNAPNDMSGLKVRTTNSQLEIGLVRSWGGNPTPLAWTETYNGLKNGVIDGMHVQPIWTYTFNMHEVLKFATAVDAIFAVQFQVMNKNTWNSMPPAIQTAFMSAAQDAADMANGEDRAQEGQFMQKLKDAKMEIYVPSAAEKRAWQAPGEAIWNTLGSAIDRDYIKDMVALR
jgi:TRAP-type C4-dicarboxylate transport system substrate-binding protein